MKRTKIVATIGPASESPEMLKKLSEAGVNIFRLNFSHGDYEEHGAKIDNIRKLGLPGGIMLDTKGAEVRTGEIINKFMVKTGDRFILTTDVGVYENTGKISVNYKEFLKDISVNTKMAIDGNYDFSVEKIEGNDVHCIVYRGSGKMASKRHINFITGEDVSMPTVIEKDWADIEFGLTKKIDFIAVSFCRHAGDLEEVRNFCIKKAGYCPHLIAKIENPVGVENLEEIVEASDGMMVARGDLGLETPLVELPIIQRRMVELCAIYSKPVIVATQMLYSMTDGAIRPTRAEVSDVANAVYQMADAVMTSEETAQSVDPENVIKTMAQIVEANEQINFDDNEKAIDENDLELDKDIKTEVAKAAINAIEGAENFIKAIVVITKSGRMAEEISSTKTDLPIFAFTDNDLVCNTMSLLRGVYPAKIKFDEKNYENTIKDAEKVIAANKNFKIKNYLLISYSIVDGKEYEMISIRSC